MEFTLDSNVIVPPLVHRYEKGDWTLLYDPRNQAVVRANPHGLLVVEAVARHPKLGDAVAYIAAIHHLELERVTAPVIEFVADLINAGFLHLEEYRPRSFRLRDELQPPSSIYIQNTEKCNLKCVYCYNAEVRDFFLRAHPQMDTQQMKWVVDQVADFGIPQVNFCGGEPTLRDDLLEVAEHARSRGRFVTMVSNGRADSDEFTTAAARLFDVIWISLDSHRPEIMQLHRGEGAYEHAVNSLRKLARVPDRRATVVVSAVISHLNWQEFAELRRFCLEDLGVDRFRATTYSPGSPPEVQEEWPLQPPPFIRDPSLPLPGEVALSDFADQMGLEAELAFDRARHTLVGGSLRRNHCGMALGELAMLSNGDVFPCQLLCKPQFLAGNVFDQPLEQIYRASPVLARLRRISVERVAGCCTCDMRYVCGGSCRANAMEMHGSLESHNTFQCEFLHRNATDSLWLDSLIPIKELAQTRERYRSAKEKLRAADAASREGSAAAAAAGRVVASC